MASAVRHLSLLRVSVAPDDSQADWVDLCDSVVKMMGPRARVEYLPNGNGDNVRISVATPRVSVGFYTTDHAIMPDITTEDNVVYLLDIESPLVGSLEPVHGIQTPMSAMIDMTPLAKIDPAFVSSMGGALIAGVVW